MERVQRLVVGCRLIAGPTQVTEEGVLGAHARVVETRRHRMRVENLTVFVLEEGHHRTVENTWGFRAEGGRVGIALAAATGGLHAE